LLGGIALLLTPAITLAQGPPPKGWAMTIGAAPIFGPAFRGSSDYALAVVPDIRFNYKDFFFASIPDGLGVNLINTDKWQVGPLVKIRFGRGEEDGGNPFLVSGGSEALLGLGDVRAAGEAGGFVQLVTGRWQTRFELRQGFGGHDGLVADLTSAYRRGDNWPLVGPVIWSIGPRLTAGSSDFINAFFGVTGQQSIDSGLPVYSAGSSLVSAGVLGAIVRPVTPRLAYTLFAGYDRLLGDVADSPLVRERGSANQFNVGLAIGYRFFW
jgi:outer membrane scaffolding protein for murein synthesis (MipA/OmpV family)